VPSRITVRRCRGADLTSVLAIERASFGADAWPREDFVDLMEKFPRLFLLGAVDAKIAGYIAAVVRGNDAELVSVAVRPRCRGRGVAGALLRHVMRLLRKEAVGQCWLMVRPGNREAIRLYRAFGFTRVRRVKDYYRRGRDGLRMRVRLQGRPPQLPGAHTPAVRDKPKRRGFARSPNSLARRLTSARPGGLCQSSS
jgi:[ribosomal protein S18]-alanine N-acetyltransferase